LLEWLLPARHHLNIAATRTSRADKPNTVVLYLQGLRVVTRATDQLRAGKDWGSYE